MSWIVLTVLILTGMVFIFGPKFSTLRKMQEDKNELKKENQRLETEITNLRTKQERFTSDPRFVERTAKEMNMIRTNEIVFIFEDQPAE
jgi:cell division protein FtsB